MASIMDSSFAAEVQAVPPDIDKLLVFCTKKKCSDLFIKVGEVPYIYRYGILYQGIRPIDEIAWNNFTKGAINSEMNTKYVREKMLDFSYKIDKYRYRVNVGYSTGANIAVFRMISEKLPTFQSLKLDQNVAALLNKAFNEKAGISLLVGATGSGKNLHKDTIIPTVDGDKRLEDIQVGDRIWAPDGTSTLVTAKYSPPEDRFYEITFSNGEKVKAGAGHLWEVSHSNRSAYEQHIEARKIIKSNFMKKLEILDTDVLMNYDRYMAFLMKDTDFDTYKFIRQYYEDDILTNHIFLAEAATIDLNKLLDYLKHNTNIYLKSKTDDDNNIYISNIKKYIGTHKSVMVAPSILFAILDCKPSVAWALLSESKLDNNIIHDSSQYCNPKALSKVLIDTINKNAIHDPELFNMKTQVMTTEDLIAYGTSGGRKVTNISVKKADACSYAEKNLAIDPYWLGVWLKRGNPFCPTIKTFEKEVKDHIEKVYPRCNTTYDAGVYILDYSDNEELMKGLKEYNLLGNKHIPEVYKYASPQQKRELLAGLLDAHINSLNPPIRNGNWNFATHSYEITDDIEEICASIGLIILNSFKHKNSKNISGWRMTRISCTTEVTYTTDIPVQSPKCIELINKCNTNYESCYDRIYINRIKEIEGDSSDYYCLSVDHPSHLFLCSKSYIPTHNTSTLAACINQFTSGIGGNENVPLRDAHLITMEDPIEYIYPSTAATRIVQKELGEDFRSFDLGIKSALREHPTHILVGETRDKETIRALVSASRTGHACISTFHTNSVSDTLARLYSYLSEDALDVMYDLIANLNFILAQELVKSRKGYLLRYQYLFVTEQIKKILNDAVAKNVNIPVAIEKLIHNKQLQAAGIAADWNF